MRLINTDKRSESPEIMDDFSLKGEVLKEALDKIATINRLLGGNKITMNGLEWLLKRNPVLKEGNKKLSILDVGCGNGDMLRMLSDYADKKHLDIKLVGIDANEFTIKHAQKLSAGYANITYYCTDIFEEIKQEQFYDVILCTLTLHHFKDDEIMMLINGFKQRSTLGIIINDLHRSAVAYYLFMALCLVFRLNSMSRNDGLVSILRGFKKHNLQNYSRQLNLTYYSLKWKWAFRYQWIIPTI